MEIGETVAIGALIGITSLVGLGTFASRIAETYKTDCETYQGYKNDYADGERYFFFDEQHLEKIIGSPNYRLEGDS